MTLQDITLDSSLSLLISQNTQTSQQSINSSSRLSLFNRRRDSLKSVAFNSPWEKILEEVVANQHYEFLEDYLNHSSWVQDYFGIKTVIFTLQIIHIRGKHNYCMLIFPDHLALFCLLLYVLNQGSPIHRPVRGLLGTRPHKQWASE